MSAVHEIITSKVLAQLEAGTAPWRRPWGGKFQWPRNLASGKPYRGINALLLPMAGYESPHWCTYKQAQALGGNVRKGEKSSPIVFWTMFEKQDAETGDDMRLPVLRYYSGFNVAQCDGIDPKHIPAPVAGASHDFNPIAACEQVLAGIKAGPEIQRGFGQACYSPTLDVVRMPNEASFTTPEGWYATLFHELGHATGHSSRLNRKGITEGAAFGSDPYGREELCAEMASAFLCGHCGIETATLDNSASYIDGWLRAIKQDARLVVTAAAQAQKAMDWLLGTTFENAAAGENGGAS